MHQQGLAQAGGYHGISVWRRTTVTLPISPHPTHSPSTPPPPPPPPPLVRSPLSKDVLSIAECPCCTVVTGAHKYGLPLLSYPVPRCSVTSARCTQSSVLNDVVPYTSSQSVSRRCGSALDRGSAPALRSVRDDRARDLTARATTARVVHPRLRRKRSTRARALHLSRPFHSTRRSELIRK